MSSTVISKWSCVSRKVLESLFRRAMRMTGNESDAWDLVQDAVERGLRRWPDAPLDEGTMRWLCVVLRNRHLDSVRSCHRRVALRADPGLLDNLVAPEPAELPLWRTIDPKCLDSALDSLPPHQKEILLLQWRDHLSLREIAGLLQVPLATAGVRAHRARNKLRAILQARTNDEGPIPLSEMAPLPAPSPKPSASTL